MIKIFMPCSGLGHVQRGFESFTRECFDELKHESSFKFTLFKGEGKSENQGFTLWNLPRNDWRALSIAKLTGRSSYNIEQLTFFSSLLPHIYRENPDVIFFSDAQLGNALWHWRRFTKKKYKLLFSNGAPEKPPFPRWDHVQQLTPVQLQLALDAGVHKEKQSLIPYGFHIPSQLQMLTPAEKQNFRSRLKLPEDKPLILSVALIDKSHKRMDYLIREIANLPEPRPYVLLLGQQDTESSEVIKLGVKLLGCNNFQVRTVDHKEVADYYKIADTFVLASLREGLPRVLVEAMSYGLPCLVHDYGVTRFVLEKHGYFANFELDGSLAKLISKALAEPNDESKFNLRHRSVYDRFSWQKLRPHYIEMIQQCANS